LALLALAIGLAVLMTGRTSTPAKGFVVRIAGVGHYKSEIVDQRSVVLHALPGGRFKINEQDVPFEDLEGRLQSIFSTRTERVAFITAAPSVPFGQVARLIDVTARHANQVALIPPSATREVEHSNDGAYLDANVPAPAAK
jgi:biopolymer transport protein ExbD